MKHIPGPWYPINYAGYWNLQNVDHYSIEDNLLSAHDFHEEIAQANAKLAAAAPDLLKALIELRQMIAVKDGNATLRTSDKFVEDFIDTAIKKATE